MRHQRLKYKISALDLLNFLGMLRLLSKNKIYPTQEKKANLGSFSKGCSIKVKFYRMRSCYKGTWKEK